MLFRGNAAGINKHHQRSWRQQQAYVAIAPIKRGEKQA